MNKLLISILTYAFVAISIGAVNAEADNGVEKVAFCERCHGVQGFTNNANVPKLAGQNKGYLIKQLTNFRKGIRRSAPMRQVTLTLTDQDIEELATYFSSINVSLKD